MRTGLRAVQKSIPEVVIDEKEEVGIRARVLEHLRW